MTGRPRVFVSRHLPEPAIELLRTRALVDAEPGYLTLPRAEFLERARGADALCIYADRLDDELLAELPTVKVIAAHWGQWDPGLVEAATRRGILVTTPADQYRWIVSGVAELIWGLMIAAGRRFAEADAFARAGRMDDHEASNKLLLGEGMSGRTLGLVGAGQIGRAVARRAAGFEMTLVYVDPVASAELDALGARRVELAELLAEADYVTLSVPEDTVHLFGAPEFAAMKSTAVFVNTGRGRAVDEVALADALATGSIAAAGLDVYENEPDIHPALLAAPNVILMPHAGGALRAERTRAALTMAQSVLDVLDGRRPDGVLNPDVDVRPTEDLP